MGRLEDLDTLTDDPYGFLCNLIAEMPDTWIPDLVARLVSVGYERGIWRKDDGASRFIGLVENKRRLGIVQD
jgi:hypothetical protein